MPRPGIELRPPAWQANTLPRRYKSRLVPQGSTSVSYTYHYYTCISWCQQKCLVTSHICCNFHNFPFVWIRVPNMLKQSKHNFAFSSDVIILSHLTYRSVPTNKHMTDPFSITKTRLFKCIENFTSKNWKFSDKKLWYFSYFCSKHTLWVLVRTASARRF